MAVSSPRARHPFRPQACALALEPRILFDGAAAVAAADTHPAAEHHDTAAPQPDAPPVGAPPAHARRVRQPGVRPRGAGRRRVARGRGAGAATGRRRPGGHLRPARRDGRGGGGADLLPRGGRPTPDRGPGHHLRDGRRGPGPVRALARPPRARRRRAALRLPHRRRPRRPGSRRRPRPLDRRGRGRVRRQHRGPGRRRRLGPGGHPRHPRPAARPVGRGPGRVHRPARRRRPHRQPRFGRPGRADRRHLHVQRRLPQRLHAGRLRTVHQPVPAIHRTRWRRWPGLRVREHARPEPRGPHRDLRCRGPGRPPAGPRRHRRAGGARRRHVRAAPR